MLGDWTRGKEGILWLDEGQGLSWAHAQGKQKRGQKREALTEAEHRKKVGREIRGKPWSLQRVTRVKDKAPWE